MNIHVNRNNSTPIYLQIKNQIRQMIVSGILPPGYRLPPERRLADSLQVNRSTVLNAYRELKADGLVDSHIGRGTIVLHDPDEPLSSSVTEPMPISWRQLYNENAARSQDPLLLELMQLINRKDMISFAAGITPPDFYPAKVISEMQQELLGTHGAGVLLHTPTEGVYGLREDICSLQSARGIDSSIEDILVLSGSQQGLDLIARIFIQPGDLIVVEEPSYIGALQVFKASGARMIGVPVDEQGMRMDLLETILSRHKPKFIYTIPIYQNPSGTVMAVERRRQLLELAYRYQIPIVEDDPYGELTYEGEKELPIKAMDQHGYVIYLSTFSKILFPGLRIGWVTAPRAVIRQFALVKQIDDLHANSLGQYLIHDYLSKELLPDHLQHLRDQYRYRRDTMIKALEKYAPADVEWNHPQGGLYIWCKLPEEIIPSKLLIRAAELGVAFVPGKAFFSGEQDRNYIRLNFSFPTPDQITAGIELLMKAVKECMSPSVPKQESLSIEINPII
jgi:DNA-binding transcriptional MocR family regulator